MLSLTHNNVVLGFDCYYDGSSYRSSGAVSNYQIAKTGNQLRVTYAFGTAQGSVPSLQIASSSGNFICNQNAIVAGNFNSSGQPAILLDTYRLALIYIRLLTTGILLLQLK